MGIDNSEIKKDKVKYICNKCGKELKVDVDYCLYVYDIRGIIPDDGGALIKQYVVDEEDTEIIKVEPCECTKLKISHSVQK